MERLQQEVASLRNKPPAAAGGGGSGGGGGGGGATGAARKRAGAPGKRGMSFEEKRNLSLNINKLDNESLVQARPPSAPSPCTPRRARPCPLPPSSIATTATRAIGPWFLCNPCARAWDGMGWAWGWAVRRRSPSPVQRARARTDCEKLIWPAAVVAGCRSCAVA
jgi:hypothetical protein